MVTLRVRSFKVIQSTFGRDIRYFKITSGSYVHTYLGKVGLDLKTPEINLEMIGCFPNSNPSIGSTTEERALRAVHMAE